MLEPYNVSEVNQTIRTSDVNTCQKGVFETQNLAPCAQIEHVISIIKDNWILFLFHLMKKGLAELFLHPCN